MADTIACTAETTGLSQPEADRLWRDLGLHTRIKIAAIVILLFILFKDEVRFLTDTWINDHSWSHGFLIPLFSLYLLNQSREEILSTEPRPNYFGLLLLIGVIVFYVFNVISPSGYAYFRSLSVVAAMGACVLLLGGFRLVKLTWLPIGYLVFALPIPQRYYVLMTMPMRRLAASVAGALMNLVAEMDATVRGVIIEVIYKGQPMEPALNVAEACSGMRLLMAFLALGVAMAYVHPRPMWQRAVLLGSTIPIAVFCNIVRVTVTGFIHVFIGTKYTQGIYHDTLGMLMLPLAFCLYGSLSWFVSSLFVADVKVVPNIILRKREQ